MSPVVMAWLRFAKGPPHDQSRSRDMRERGDTLWTAETRVVLHRAKAKKSMELGC